MNSILSFPEEIRRKLLIKEIADMPSDEFDKCCFTLFADEDLYEAWIGKTPMTQDLYKKLGRVFNSMESPTLIFELIEKYPNLHSISQDDIENLVNLEIQ